MQESAVTLISILVLIFWSFFQITWLHAVWMDSRESKIEIERNLNFIDISDDYCKTVKFRKRKVDEFLKKQKQNDKWNVGVVPHA